MNYGEEIRRIRKQQGLSISELARLAEVRPQNIHNMENGLRKPSESLFCRIIAVMGFKLEKKIKKL